MERTTQEPARKSETSDRPFSQALRQAADKPWTAATRHRFVKELAEDKMDNQVYKNYLIQDHAFVDALVRLVARAVAAAPGMEEKRRLSAFLAMLTSEENDYFERSFDALEVSEKDRGEADLSPVTYAFEDLFRAAVEEYEYVAAVAALLPVEWTYLDWATWAKNEGTASERFWIKEWIDIHQNREFKEFVDWLRQQVDTHGASLGPSQRKRIEARFVRAVELEVEFFDDAYGVTG